MTDKIVKVYVLKGLNGISLVIEDYRVSNEKIYGMLTPIYTFEVSTDDILQAIGYEHNQSDDCVSREQAVKTVLDWYFDLLEGNETKDIVNLLDALPPVTPTHGTCKDCSHRDPEDKMCDCGHTIQWQLPREDNWYCADFKKRGNENGSN